MEAVEQTPENEDYEAPPDGLPARLKAALRAGIFTLRRVKQGVAARFQRAPAEAEEKAEDARADKGVRDRADESEVVEETGASPRKLWVSLLIYSSVLLVGAGTGGGYAYYYLSTMLTTRSDEIVRLRSEITQQTKYAAESKKKVDAEQAKRISAENRLALMLANRENPNAPSQEGGPATRSAADTRVGNCQLRSGAIGATLKDCIADFNRK